jgi:L-ascorbate metabolism protein UlaG (beta-lactamase superfamily)
MSGKGAPARRGADEFTSGETFGDEGRYYAESRSRGRRLRTKENHRVARSWRRRLSLLAIVLGSLAGLWLLAYLHVRDAVGGHAEGERLSRVTSSPQWKDGRFVNTLARHDGPFFTMLSRWFQGAPNTEPTAPLPVETRKPGDFANPPADGLRVTWFGHSTLWLEIDGARVLIDPVFGERCSPSSIVGPKRFHAPPIPLAELPKPDVVVISHDHYDHLDYPSIVELSKKGALFAVPLGVGAHLEAWGVPRERISELDWWQHARIGKLTLTATPARHFSGRSPTMSDQDQTLWAGWVMQGAKHRAFYSGDTAMFPGFREIGQRLGPFDLTMIEVGAYNALWADVHLGPEQAVAAHEDLRGAVMLPVHWGTFNLALHPFTEPVERVLLAAKKADVKVVSPRVGQMVDLAQPPPVERWWPNVPFETAEQAPVVSSGLAP